MRFFIGFVVFFFSAELVFSQCGFQKQAEDCRAHLAQSKGKYLKTFEIAGKVNGNKEPIKQQYIFSKNTYYFMSICSEDGMYVNLYDRQNKLIGTSYDPKSGKHYPAMTFRCAATGVYYFHFFFLESGEGKCGTAALGYDY